MHDQFGDRTSRRGRLLQAVAGKAVGEDEIGHYDYNTLDQNAILGPHPEVANFYFANGFSGHGLQHAPAVGRGIAEWLTAGRYVSLDLSALGYERIAKGQPLREDNII